MRQAVTTFVGGVIVGAGLLGTTGYLARFQRPVRQASPPVAASPIQKCSSGWIDDEVFQANIPTELQQCVGRETTGDHNREMERFHNRMKWSLERAVGTCVAMQKTPPSITGR